MIFLILICTIIFVGSLLGWFSVSLVFSDCRKKRYCFIWLLVTIIALLLYYYVQGIARGGFEVVDALVRQQMLKFAVFWFVLQIAFVAVLPLYVIFVFVKRRLLAYNKEVVCKVVAVLLLFIPLMIAAKAVYWQDEWRIVNVEIASAKVPKELSGFKIAQISDTHVLFPEEVAVLREQLTAVVKEKPDIIIFTGDLSDSKSQIAATVSAFKEVEDKAPLGLWFILGNHEYIQGVGNFLSVYDEQGISLLRNDGVIVYHNGVPVYLAGVDYPFDRLGDGMRASLAVAERDLQVALAKREDGQFTILAAHHPLIFDKAFEQDVFLTLSGHTHAYQVGYDRKSLNIFTDYSWGLYEKSDLFGYVSSGAGEWFPARFGAPQEVVIFTLKHLD